jgi:hypothetical protein
VWIEKSVCSDGIGYDFTVTMENDYGDNIVCDKFDDCHAAMEYVEETVFDDRKKIDGGAELLENNYIANDKYWYYEPVNVAKEFTYNKPHLKQENLQQTIDEVRAKVGNAQEQEQSKGR